MTNINFIIKALISINKAQQCLVCHQYCFLPYPLCKNCSQHLSIVPSSHCITCIAPTTQKYCGMCTIKKPYFKEIITYYSYDKLCQYLLQQMKFNQNICLAVFFGMAISKLISTKNFDYIIYVPIHHKRWRKRLYNPCHIIAKTISAETNIFLLNNALIKKSHTKSLSLSNNRNFNSSYKSFKLVKKIQGHILLIDDIITSGNTVNSIAKLLLENYAQTVTVAAAIKVI